MKIASWNINSIKARGEHVFRWLDNTQVDILFMQELKGVEETFPKAQFEERGYHLAINAQKTYNGVAIASKFPIEVISNSILDGDEQARFLEVDINGIRMMNCYMPNGNPVDSEKYPYKLNWTKNLINKINLLKNKDISFLIGGDFNIIPTINDVHNPKAWEGDALYRQESWELYRTMINTGLYDAYRLKHPHETDCYTFWDYQGGAWPQNNGIRIDHFLLTADLADRLKSCTIDREPRGWDKASDHTPIIIEL
jgi:exodeoxyribonuclease-3